MITEDIVDIESLCDVVENYPEHRDRALSFLVYLYEMEHSDALFRVSLWALDDKYGLNISTSDCIEALTLASSLGQVEATYHLAAMYEEGEYVEMDTSKAGELYMLAAFRGDPTALKEFSSVDSKVFRSMDMRKIAEIAKKEVSRISEYRDV